MRYIKNFKEWRSEEIVKLFLLNTGLFNISDSYSFSDKGIDFLITCKKNYETKIGIEIKATKYSRGEIVSKYSKKKYDLPFYVIQFFINYDKEGGYFRINKEGKVSELELLKKDNFINMIKNYAQQCI